jgi:hypothetical protein
VVVEISQITESAGYVVVVVVEHIHKFEVIGNVKNWVSKQLVVQLTIF